MKNKFRHQLFKSQGKSNSKRKSLATLTATTNNCYWMRRSVEILFERKSRENHFPHVRSLPTFPQSREGCARTQVGKFWGKTVQKIFASSAQKAEFGAESMWKCDTKVASLEVRKRFAPQSRAMSWKVDFKSSISHPSFTVDFSWTEEQRKFIFTRCVGVCVVL